MMTWPKPVRACAIRVTRLNGSDVPLDPLTCNSRIQTNAFIRMGVSPDIEEGEVLETRSQCGDICIVDRDCPTLKGAFVELLVCGAPFALLEMMLGVNLASDDEGVIVGAGLRDDRANNCASPLMVEIWSRNARPSCDPLYPDGKWVHWVLPRTTLWNLSGDLAFENGPVEFSLSGYAEQNRYWYPSLPGPDFPSYVPGGGDPSGWPTGPAGPVLPTGVDPDPFTLADQAVVRQSGPVFWRLVPDLPDPMDSASYLPCGVGA